MFVSSNLSLEDILAATIASVLDATGPVHASVKLAQGPFAPLPDSDPTTFTEATFDGYAAKDVTAWASPYLVATGAAETISSTVLHWAPTGTTTPNTLTGYWIVGGNGDYLGGEAFPVPIPMTGPTSALNLIPIWQQAAAQFGAVVVP